MRPAQDGGLWFGGSGSRVWHRNPSGTVDSLLLPAGVTAWNLAEVAPGDVWVSSDKALYRNRPVPQPGTIVIDCPDPDVDPILEHCKARIAPLESSRTP